MIETDRVRLPERYEPVAHVATGGMASVWCATDRLLGRRVAIKLLAECFLADGTARARFLREARVAALLSNHPHVVTIYDVGEADGRAFIVMEYLAGGSVADAMRHRVVTRSESLRWLRSAAEALDYAHEHGVIHRDVKPSNLLLDTDASLRVADFGIARLATEEPITMTGYVLGSAGYLAPEQVDGKPATDASDRYALAVTASELLLGHRPVAEPIQRPTALGEVLARGTASRPDQRWRTCVELVDALEDAISRPVKRTAARPVPPPAPVTIRMTTPRVRAFAALAAFAFALGAAFGAVHDSSHPVRAANLGTHHRALAPAHPSSTKPAPARTTATLTATAPPAAGTPQTTTTPASPGGAGGPANPDNLEAQGHQLMASGSYSAAIDTLRKAVTSSSPGSLTHAYALYDLGRSLRLSGNPQAAIPVLEQRLKIPNQAPIVRNELALALAAAGLGPAPAPAHGKGKHKGKGHGD